MQVKKKLRTFLPPGCFDFLRYLKFRIFKNSKCAPHGIDEKLSKYLNFKYGFFIELGANDGFTESSTFWLEKKKNWRGVLIEPLPDQFLSCCYYRNSEGNKLFCTAVVDFKYKKKFVEIGYSNLMSTLKNFKTQLKNVENHIDVGLGHLSNNIKKFFFFAKATTLTEILDQSDAPNIIDFIAIDVEGVELSVLNGIDFKKYKFKYMMIECRDPKSIKKFLKKKNYEFIEQLTFHDYLFKLKKNIYKI